MKVYQVNDCEWIAAPDGETAMTWHEQETGIPAADGRECGYPIELGAEAMERMRHVGDGDGSDPRFPCSFREALAIFLAESEGNGGQPFFFASTEF